MKRPVQIVSLHVCNHWQEITRNLLRNALDAMREVPQPELELLLAAGDDVLLTVRDNGPGARVT